MEELKSGVPPSMPVICSWCEAQTSHKYYFYSSCFRPAVSVKAEDRTTEGEIRESHALALGTIKVEMQ